MKRLLRPIALLTSLATLGSCARILYPERVGNRGGTIDTLPLVVDILLFIPGLIPGVIALVVDFTTGAIYVGGGKATNLSKADVGREGEIAIKARELPKDAVATLRLVDMEGNVLDEDVVDSRGPKPRHRLSVDLANAAAAFPEGEAVDLQLQMQLDDNPPAVYALRMR